MRPVPLLLALATACAARGSTLPPRPARCAAETVPGLDTRGVAWSAGRWVAAIPEGSALSLRAFNAEGAVDGDGLAVLDEPVRRHGVGLVATARGALVAAATARSPATVRVLSVEGASVTEARDVAVTTEGDLALIPRAGGAALLTERGGRTELRAVSSEGAVGAARRCPEGVTPRSVAAWQDGYVAVTRAGGVSVVFLDEDCAAVRSARVAEGEMSSRPAAIAVDGDGAVLSWTDGESRAWVAGVDHGGAVRVRPTALEAGTEHAAVILAPDAQGRRAELRVIAVRSNEVQSRLQLYRFDPRGTLRDVGGITAAPALLPLAMAPDPWGGAMVVWSRLEGAPGGLGARPSLAFFSRVCP